MEHRADQILDTVTAILKAAATEAGDNVDRGRLRAPTDETFINVLMGSDDPLNANIAFSDSELLVYVDLHVPADPAQTHLQDKALLALRKQVQITLMADRKLGLAFVTQIIPDGAQDPMRQAERELELNKLRTRWRVHYRTSITDPSN